jgi:hypothetical protein
MVRFSTPTKQCITQFIYRRRILASASSFIRTRSAGRLVTLIATLFGGTFCVLAQTILFGSSKEDETILFGLLKEAESHPLHEKQPHLRKPTNITDSALSINQKQFPDEANIFYATGTETEYPTSNVPKGSYHYPNTQSNTSGGLKVMLFVTTHMSSQHIWHLKSCWPPALQNSVLLNTADAVVYLNPKEEERKEAMNILKHTFRDQNLTIHVRDNPGYQEGAMAALSDATREGWFSGYDWVIRVNPDVIIRDDTFMVDVMENDPNATGLLINCSNFTNSTEDLKIHTDFFAIKPGVLPSGAFLNPTSPNAERTFTNDISEAILNKGNHRWIPGAHPVDEGICRAGYDYYESRKMEEIPVIHFHPEEELMREFTCPIPF